MPKSEKPLVGGKVEEKIKGTGLEKLVKRRRYEVKKAEQEKKYQARRRSRRGEAENRERRKKEAPTIEDLAQEARVAALREQVLESKPIKSWQENLREMGQRMVEEEEKPKREELAEELDEDWEEALKAIEEKLEEAAIKVDISEMKTVEQAGEIEVPGVELKKFNEGFEKIEETWFEEGEKMSKNPDEFAEKWDKLLGKMDLERKIKLNEEQTRVNLAGYQNALNDRESGLGDEYVNTKIDLNETENIINKLAAKLNLEFGYNVNKGGLFKKFRAKRKLDPQDAVDFENTLFEYEALTKYHKQKVKENDKKFGKALLEVESGHAMVFAGRGGGMRAAGAGIGTPKR